MGSTLVSRNVTVAGRRTSVRLEPAMWRALNEICQRERCTIHDYVTEVDRTRSASSLTAAIRVSLLQYFRAMAAPPEDTGPPDTAIGRVPPRSGPGREAHPAAR